jgi:hypothetical protein
LRSSPGEETGVDDEVSGMLFHAACGKYDRGDTGASMPATKRGSGLGDRRHRLRSRARRGRCRIEHSPLLPVSRQPLRPGGDAACCDSGFCSGSCSLSPPCPPCCFRRSRPGIARRITVLWLRTPADKQPSSEHRRVLLAGVSRQSSATGVD